MFSKGILIFNYPFFIVLAISIIIMFIPNLFSYFGLLLVVLDLIYLYIVYLYKVKKWITTSKKLNENEKFLSSFDDLIWQNTNDEEYLSIRHYDQEILCVPYKEIYRVEAINGSNSYPFFQSGSKGNFFGIKIWLYDNSYSSIILSNNINYTKKYNSLLCLVNSAFINNIILHINKKAKNKRESNKLLCLQDSF